ncbi:MAG: D-aminoacyl-tRNA deacylase [Bacteroidaceae bacterium]|nr:D-aminoacyl-tRNA deacylase [Bacteroidaceae bacterium]
MRLVLQRVSSAQLRLGSVSAEPHATIGHGYVILLGCSADDTDDDIDWLASKVANLRVMDDEQGVMNRSILETKGDVLVVSQFTLWASYRKGNRPSYLRAGSHEVTEPLYHRFCEALTRRLGKPVRTGVFGADMKVSLVNDGPVTICMDTKNKE